MKRPVFAYYFTENKMRVSIFSDFCLKNFSLLEEFSYHKRACLSM